MQFHISLKDRVRILLTRTATIEKDVAIVRDELQKEFTHPNPLHETRPREQKYIYAYIVDRYDDGSTYLSLPRGGFKRIREIIDSYGHSWKTVDGRVFGDSKFIGAIPKLKRPLWDYQQEAIDAAVRFQNCLIRAPTGSGKTTAAFGAISAINLPALVVVYNGGLFRQWARRCVDELGMNVKDVGLVKGPVNRWKFGAITIASSSTLAKHPEFFSEHGWRFGVVLADEVQGFAARTMYHSVDPCPAKFRIGVSADETRKDKLECLVYDLFGNVACDIQQKRVIDSGTVLDVRIKVVPTDFTADWYKALNQREMTKTARDTAYKRLIDEMIIDDARNEMAIELTRSEALRGLQVIVWSTRVEHCRLIDNTLAHRGVLSGLMLGCETAEFERTRDGLVNGTLNAGVGTVKAIGQAVDIPLAARGVITTPLATNRQQFGQVRGRICRTAKDKGKVNAELYYLWDHKVFSVSQVENLVKWYGKAVAVKRGMEWVDGRIFAKEQRKLSKQPSDDFFASLME